MTARENAAVRRVIIEVPHSEVNVRSLSGDVADLSSLRLACDALIVDAMVPIEGHLSEVQRIGREG